MAKIHLRGSYILFSEREQNTYLKNYENYHTKCGYLNFKTDTLSYSENIEEVTCNRCLKKYNNLK